jgi:hypothetical protein
MPVWLFSTCGYGKGSELPKNYFSPDNQRWIDCGKYWLGMWMNEVGSGITIPKPYDLERKETIWSSGWRLGDGQVWNVPIVPIDLPTVMRVVDGTPQMVPHDAYSDLLDIAKRYWDYRQILIPFREELAELDEKLKSCERNYIAESEKPEPNKPEIERSLASIKEYTTRISEIGEKLKTSSHPVIDQAMDCVRVLAKNYFVRENELSMLGVLTTKAINLVISYCFLDYGPVEEQKLAEKKG